MSAAASSSEAAERQRKEGEVFSNDVTVHGGSGLDPVNT